MNEALTLYFQLIPSLKPCQRCQGKEYTSAYLFLGASGIVCPACLAALIEKVTTVLQIIPIDTIVTDLQTGEHKQINQAKPGLAALNALLGDMKIDL